MGRTPPPPFGIVCVVLSCPFLAMPAKAWEPTHQIQIVVPAGTGGGAHQMARVMQGIISRHNLSKQTVVVVNKSGGAGFLAHPQAK